MSEDNKIQVNIDNFQSIKSAELEFIKGINLIVGEGNSGKSATLRAIRSAILNPKGNKSLRFIHNGTSGLSVNLNYLGNDITWIKNKKDSKYIINGEEYQKVGNSNLSKILDKSGFVLDDNDKLMNVEGELELPFPFDKNPSDLFKLFEKSIFCVSDSALILKTIKTDEDTVHKDKVNAEYELNRFNKKLIALEELSEEINLDKLREGKIKLEELYFQYEKLVEEYNKVIEGYRAAKILKDAKAEVKATDITKYTLLNNNVEKLQNAKALLSILSTTKEEVKVDFNMESLFKVQDSINKLNSLKIAISTLSSERELVKSINLDSYKKVKNDFIQYNKTIAKYKEILDKVKAIQVKCTNLNEELKQFKVCPLCGQKLGNN